MNLNGGYWRRNQWTRRRGRQEGRGSKYTVCRYEKVTMNLLTNARKIKSGKGDRKSNRGGEL
jgi:hypothetical protein